MSDPSISTPPADRYGTRPARRPGRGRTVAIVAALVAAVVLVAWFSFEQSRSNPVSYEDVGFDVLGPEQVDVTFQVHMPPGTTAVCTVEALAPSYAQVGTVDVPVGPSDQTTSTYTVQVRTSEEATSGVVAGCEPTD
ncbi:hypothetical protein GCM10009809_04110 [Isoptericola hypogeus]|uniref:DUF4307 domain-containing protein n=1 Tax=Isoptericola hypogeus TaxID=300179 RepID=A0ABN2IT01_9MICO